MKPQKRGAVAKSELVKKKPDTEIYLLARTVIGHCHVGVTEQLYILTGRIPVGK